MLDVLDVLDVLGVLDVLPKKSRTYECCIKLKQEMYQMDVGSILFGSFRSLAWLRPVAEIVTKGRLDSAMSESQRLVKFHD